MMKVILMTAVMAITISWFLTPFHGHIAPGIIAAARNNGIGMDGVADNVEIMMVRAVPDGDEHDKDIALAIRYAVDNGARIINMSFGKDFHLKRVGDEAFRYAEKKAYCLFMRRVTMQRTSTQNIISNPIYANGKGRASM